MLKATIAIITCRRPDGLKRLLDALSAQKLAADTKLDILVVDNACQKEIRELVKVANNTSPFQIHYECEPESGIVYARNRCVSCFLKSDSQYLLFIDDDEWPAKESWAQDLLTAQVHHQADIVASHVVSVGEVGTPLWALELLYGKPAMREGQPMPIFYTGNVLICRKVLEVVKPAFDERFAMTGASDYHFALKCTHAKFKAVYTDAPVIEEFPRNRATVKWFMRRGFRSGIGYTRSHLFEEGLAKTIARCLLMGIARLIRGVFKLFLGVLTFNKTRLIDALFRFASAAGTLAGFFGVTYHEYQERHEKML